MEVLQPILLLILLAFLGYALVRAVRAREEAETRMGLKAWMVWLALLVGFVLVTQVCGDGNKSLPYFDF